MTAALIAIIDSKTKEVSSIRVHCDGYPEHMGKLLSEHYNNVDRIYSLIYMGNASCICEKLEPISGRHDFDHRQKGVSVFYIRDRGDSQVEEGYRKYKNKKEFMEKSVYYDVDYIYLFNPSRGTWRYYKEGNTKRSYPV